MDTLLDYNLLATEIASYKANFEQNKTAQIEQLLEQKQLLMLELKELSDFTEMQTKIESINKIGSEIETIKKQTADNLQPQLVFLFNGKLFSGRKNVTGRIKDSKKVIFPNGTLIQLQNKDIIDPKIYRVVDNGENKPFVIDAKTNLPYSPSKLVENFMVNYLGKVFPPNFQGTSGLSNPYWKKIETEQTEQTN